jgi:hypothetical protein
MDVLLPWLQLYELPRSEHVAHLIKQASRAICCMPSKIFLISSSNFKTHHEVSISEVVQTDTKGSINSWLYQWLVLPMAGSTNDWFYQWLVLPMVGSTNGWFYQWLVLPMVGIYPWIRAHAECLHC